MSVQAVFFRMRFSYDGNAEIMWELRFGYAWHVRTQSAGTRTIFIDG